MKTQKGADSSVPFLKTFLVSKWLFGDAHLDKGNKILSISPCLDRNHKILYQGNDSSDAICEVAHLARKLGHG